MNQDNKTRSKKRGEKGNRFIEIFDIKILRNRKFSKRGYRTSK